MRPAWASTMPLQIGSPSPAPCRSARFAFQNRSKTCGRSSAGMPTPVSATENSTSPPASPRPDRDAPACGVNLIAFPTRFSNTWQQAGPIAPDRRQLRARIESQLERRRRGERLLGLHASTRSSSRLSAVAFDGQRPGLDAGRVEQIFNETVRAVDGAHDELDAPSLGRAVTRELVRDGGGGEADGAEGIANVVGDDGEHVVARARRVLRGLVEPRIFNRERGPVSQLHRKREVALLETARRRRPEDEGPEHVTGREHRHDDGRPRRDRLDQREVLGALGQACRRSGVMSLEQLGASSSRSPSS